MTVDPSLVVLFGPGGPFADGPFKDVPPGDVQVYAQLLVQVCTHRTPDGGMAARVAVCASPGAGGSEPPFEVWMCAAEYLMACAVRRSGLAFDAAVDKLREGAKNYQNLGAPESTPAARPPFSPDPAWKKPPTPEG